MNVSPIHQNGKLELDLPREQYDRLQRINFSNLKHMKKSPAHVRHALMQPFEDTDAKKVGRCVHLAVLEPETFRARVCVWDLGPRKGKEWEAFKARNAGLEILTENEYQLVSSVAAAARADKLAAPYISGGRREVSLLWNHVTPTVGELAGYNIACKGRIDFEALEVGAIVDLKAAKDVSPEGFARATYEYRYHTQAAWYLDGYERITGKRVPFFVVAVENREPYPVVVYRVPDKLLELGREEYRGWLDRYHLCTSTATWPGYAVEPLELALPYWASPEDEDSPDGLDLVGL